MTAKMIDRIALASMSPGTSRHLVAHRYGRPGARPKAYIQCSIHADEIPAMLAGHHLMRELDRASAEGRILGEIVLVPVANPIGLAQNVNGVHPGRYEMRGGGNFNRNWPDLTRSLAEAVAAKLGPDPEQNVAVIRAELGARIAALEPEAEWPQLRRELYRLAYDADIVLDMHCDDDALMHIYLSPDFWPAGADLAADLGARAILLADESGGNCFEETFFLAYQHLARHFAGRFPIPLATMTSTVEFRGQADVGDAWGEKDGQALFRFLQRRKIVAGDPGPLPALLGAATPLDAADYSRAKSAGILAYAVKPGDRVKRGDLIAEIVDPLADDPWAARRPILAATDGLVLSRCLKKLIAPGEGTAMIVGETKLAHRQGPLLSD